MMEPEIIIKSRLVRVGPRLCPNSFTTHYIVHSPFCRAILIYNCKIECSINFPEASAIKRVGTIGEYKSQCITVEQLLFPSFHQNTVDPQALRPLDPSLGEKLPVDGKKGCFHFVFVLIRIYLLELVVSKVDRKPKKCRVPYLTFRGKGAKVFGPVNQKGRCPSILFAVNVELSQPNFVVAT